MRNGISQGFFAMTSPCMTTNTDSSEDLSPERTDHVLQPKLQGPANRGLLIERSHDGARERDASSNSGRGVVLISIHPNASMYERIVYY